MNVVYLTNQYPKPSHTFIRREIAAVERAGVLVERVSIRPAGAALVDPDDLAERARTRVLLSRGALGLLPSALAIALRHPRRALRGLRAAWALAPRSASGVLRHLAYLAEASLLLRWCAAARAEHVHAHFSTNPAAVALLCRELGGPRYSFTAHGTADLEAASTTALALKIERAAFAVAVCDDGLRKLARSAPPGHAHKLHLVRCGVDAAFFTAAQSGARAVPAAARLVCVARLGPEKGCDVLLRALRLLADARIEFQLALVGDGPQRGALERLAVELGLGARVEFLGWQSGAAVREQILAARALVLASRSEGLPVVIMEAFALQRPVIATAVGGIAELVVPGQTGWLVQPSDPRALADAMAEALRRPAAELAALGTRGAARVRARHAIDDQALVMVALLRAARGPSLRRRDQRLASERGATHFPVRNRVLRSIEGWLRRA
ncbi:MAG: colanic acid biosynthesis glycosyltransferase WcaL [Planctomycetota bacterium]|nr:MAG: colanic acid biosynthesis glycosyltransferase WcaL [Planctomycetota bacterium]